MKACLQIGPESSAKWNIIFETVEACDKEASKQLKRLGDKLHDNKQGPVHLKPSNSILVAFSDV